MHKPRVVFLIYHGAGHFNACFRLAKAISVVYDVVFAGVQFFSEQVSSQGFQYYPLNTVPFGTGLEYWLNTTQKKKPFYLNTLKDRWQDKLFKQRQKELSSMVMTLQPDLILLDAQQSSDFIVLHPLLVEHEIAFATLHTMLPTTLQNNTPPLNSLVVPGETHAIKKANAAVRRKNFQKRFQQKIQYLLADDQFIVNRAMQKNSIPSKFISGESSFGLIVNEVPTLILAPEEFNFREAKKSINQQYLGLSVDSQRIEHCDERYLINHQNIFDTLRSRHLSLIYCGFGSIPQDNEKHVLLLLSKIIEAVREQPCLLLVSLNLDPAKTQKFQSEQVHIFRRLPQLEILRDADLFITHGGLNSIKESILSGVPMLVYPVEFKTDHPGNAVRIEHHQIGLRGEIQNDSPDNIFRKIDTLLSEDVFRKNLSIFQQAEKEMDDEKLISIIQSIPDFKI